MKKSDTLKNFIDKFFRLKTKWFKNKKILSLMLVATLTLSGGIATGTYFGLNSQHKQILITPEEKDITYYNLWGNNFSTYQNAIEYAKSQLKSDHYAYDAYRYQFEGKEFVSQKQFFDYLNGRFSIKQLSTIKNPENYLVNNSGEIAKTILTGIKEDYMKVYSGADNMAYKSSDEAINTYKNLYSKKYIINEQSFDNEDMARFYYENVVRQNLGYNKIGNTFDPSKAQKTTCFLQGNGFCQTKEEIKAWLNQNSKKGFEYDGKAFNDYDKAKFEQFLSEDNPDFRKIKNDNIKEVENAQIYTHWLSLPENAAGYFVGPQLVETPTSEKELKERVENNNNWQVDDNFTPSLFLMPLAMSAFGGVVDILMWDEKESEKTFNFRDYLSNNGERKYDILKIFSEISQSKLGKDIISGDYDINAFKNKESLVNKKLSSFEKMLVGMKRINNLILTRDTQEDAITKLHGLFLDIIYDKLTGEKMSDNKSTDENALKDFFNTTFNCSKKDFIKNYNFDDIYAIFLNPSKFMVKNEAKESILNLTKNIQSTIDTAANMVSDVSSFGEDMENLLEDPSKKGTTTKVITKETIDVISKKHEEVNLKFEEKIKSGSLKNDKKTKWINRTSEIQAKKTEYIKASHSKTTTSVTKIGGETPSSPITTAVKVWELSKMLSFISIKTYRIPIDENQSLYYVVPTPKIPVLNIEFPVDKPKIGVDKLIDSPLKDLYSGAFADKNKIPTVYQFKSNYYLNYDNAVHDLKRSIFKNPSEYLKGTRNIIVNVMDKYDTRQIPDRNKGEDENTYNERCENIKQDFIEELFNKYYKTNEHSYYLDGFGKYFDDPLDALRSMEENIGKKNFKIAYQYVIKDKNGEVLQTILKDSEQEILKTIEQSTPIDEKTIINTDLIKTANFSELINNPDQLTYKIYELDYYGQLLYFKSQFAAWSYMLNHINYTQAIVHTESIHLSLKDLGFYSLDEFLLYLQKEIKVEKAAESKVKFNDLQI